MDEYSVNGLAVNENNSILIDMKHKEIKKSFCSVGRKCVTVEDGSGIVDIAGKALENVRNTKILPQFKPLDIPLKRVRDLMKLDPDLHIASNEANFAVTRATELFIASFAREAFSYTLKCNKKVIQKRDVDAAMEAVDSLTFLDGIMNI